MDISHKPRTKNKTPSIPLHKYESITGGILAAAAFTLLLITHACSASAEEQLPEELANIENVTLIPVEAEPERLLNPRMVAEYGESEDVNIGWIRALTVDPNGRVFMADDSRNTILVFNPDGSYLTRIGREGDGPGEFRGIRQIRSDSLYLHAEDANNLTITRFDLETLEYKDAVRFPFHELEDGGGYTHYLNTFYLMGPDRYLIQYDVGYVVGLEDSGQKPDIKGYLLNRNTGEYESDSVFSFPDSESLYMREEENLHLMHPVYMRTGNIMAGSQNRIIHGWSENILFTVYDLDGKPVQAIYKPQDNLRLNPDDVYKIYEDLSDPWKTMVMEDNLPESWPAYAQAVTDDRGGIWAAMFTEDIEVYEWTRFDLSGSVSASFRWPRDRNIRLIRDGYIYTLERDPETEVQKIVKYELDG